MIKTSFRNITYTLVLCLFFTKASAQEPTYKEPTGLNNWYIELGGSGLFYSGNYEKILIKTQRWGWVGRVGLGYNPTDFDLLNKVYLDKGTVMAPFDSSVLFGPNKEKLEA